MSGEHVDLDSELDALFGLLPDAFIPARNALADWLRALGRRPEADAVRALRKPSLAMWATNQLPRRQPEDVAALLDLGARLREAQGTGAGDAAALREAGAARRKLVARLSARAGEILAAEGVAAPGAHLERVTRTLLAAGDDAEGARALHDGRLTHELSPSGFGALGGLVPEATEDNGAAAEEERRRAERLRVDDLTRRARAAEAEAARLEVDASEAEAVAQRARRAAQKARDRAEEVRAAADEALSGD